MTGPVARFCRQIAGQGYIVAAPSSYHEFTGPEPLAYDVPGTDAGNEWKVKKVRVVPLHPFELPSRIPTKGELHFTIGDIRQQCMLAAETRRLR